MMVLAHAVLGCLLVCSTTDPARVFHVSADGDDAAAGTLEQPFASLVRARDAVRALKSEQGGTLRQPVVVELHAGTYRLNAPLHLDPGDSGTADAPIVYRARSGDLVLVSGGRQAVDVRIETIEGRTLWIADLPENPMAVHNIWVGGRRAVRARHPNVGQPLLVPESVPGVEPGSPIFPGTRELVFRNGDLPMPIARVSDVDLWAYHYWIGEKLAVDSIDPGSRLVRFTVPAHMRLGDGFGESEPVRYHAEGVREFLDAPGEWWIDGESRKLFYIPHAGESLATDRIEIPRLTTLVQLEGEPSADRFVEHVGFEGITFAHTEWWPQRTETIGDQAAVPVPAAIELVGARKCRIVGCTLRNLGTYGVRMGAGCRDNVLSRCELVDLAAGGVKIGETVIRPQGPLRTGENTVEDCVIHEGGRTFRHAVGIWIGQSPGNRIAHNAIHDFFYTGISVGWTWGYGEGLATGNLIAKNHVYQIGQGLLSDMAGIYTLGDQRGTVIRDNCFHDVVGHNYGGWGIYYDEGTTGIVAEGNLVYRTTDGGFHQHYGKDNVFRNNIIAFGRDAQIQRTRVEPHRSFTFERNIVLYDEGTLLEGDWSQRNADLNRNVYWRRDGATLDFAGKSWDDWRAAGADTESLIADPRLANPAADDFSVESDSPAFKLGFEPLHIDDIGPRPMPRDVR